VAHRLSGEFVSEPATGVYVWPDEWVRLLEFVWQLSELGLTTTAEPRRCSEKPLTLLPNTAMQALGAVAPPCCGISTLPAHLCRRLGTTLQCDRFCVARLAGTRSGSECLVATRGRT
jgi:hypothetical protein